MAELVAVSYTTSGLIGVVPSAAAPIGIFNFTRYAKAGEEIMLQGDFSRYAKAYYNSENDLTPRQLFPAGITGSVAQVHTHSTFVLPPSDVHPYELRKVWVQDGFRVFAPVYINRATIHFLNTNELIADGSIEIHGINLQFVEGKAKVELVPVNGVGGNLTCTVVAGANKWCVRVITPSSTVGKQYRVRITNGFGGVDGWSELSEVVTYVASGNDSFVFGWKVPFAHKLTFAANEYKTNSDSRLAEVFTNGNGVFDNGPAIQAAIDKANAAGGGVVVLPDLGSGANTYKVASQIFLKSRTFLKCEGGASVLVEDSPGEKNYSSIFNWISGTTQAGLINVKYVNTATDNILFPWGNGNLNSGREIVISGCNFTLNESKRMDFIDSKQIVFINNTWRQGVNINTGSRSPMLANDSEYVRVEGCTFYFSVDAAINTSFCRNLIVANNVMYWDGYKGNPMQGANHFVVIGGTTNMDVYSNTFNASYTPGLKNIAVKRADGAQQNSGEAIIAERPGGNVVDTAVGKVTGSTLRSIFDNTRNFNTQGFPDAPVKGIMSLLQTYTQIGVKIVAGKGMGQIRQLVSNTATELTVDRDWDVQPDTTSRYVACTWTCRYGTLRNNTFNDVMREVLLYFCFMTEMYICENTSTDSGCIDVSGIHIKETVNWDGITKKVDYATTAWNIYVDNNVSRSPTDQTNGMLTGFHPVQHVIGKSIGVVQLNAHMRNNINESRIPSLQVLVDSPHKSGYHMRVEWHPSGLMGPDEGNFNCDPQFPPILGAIITNNQAINCANGINTSSGCKNIFIRNQTNTNCTSAILNEQYTGNVSGAVNLLMAA